MEDGSEVITGEFSMITKSIYRAYLDCIKLFGGKLTIFNYRLKLAIITVGNKRLVISGGYCD